MSIKYKLIFLFYSIYKYIYFYIYYIVAIFSYINAFTYLLIFYRMNIHFNSVTFFFVQCKWVI